jgi:hypothetical protein
VHDLSKHDFCGQAQFTLGHLMGGAGQLTVPIQGGGQLVAHAEEISACAEHVSFQLRGIKLKNKAGFFGTSDPFITGSRISEGGRPVRFYKSEVIMDNLSPTWPKVNMSVQKVCNGDIDRPLLFEVWDWDSRGKHVNMGDFTTSVRELADNGAGFKFAVNVSGWERRVRRDGRVGLMNERQTNDTPLLSGPPRPTRSPPHLAPATCATHPANRATKSARIRARTAGTWP